MKKHTLRGNQDGVATIIIVFIIISILTLIVLSFSGLIRREQRQALDQQLSAQARFAAETSVNELISLYRSDPSSMPTLSSNECINPPGDKTFGAGVSDEIETTCLVVNTAPTEIIKKTDPQARTVYWINPAGPINRLVLLFQIDEDTSGKCVNRPYHINPSRNGSGSPGDENVDYIGSLRFDLARMGQAGSSREGNPFTRTDLTQNLFGGVMTPSSHSSRNSTVSYNPSDSFEPVAFGSCNDPAPLAGLEGIPPGYSGAYAIINVPNSNDNYIMTTRSIYSSTYTELIGFNSSGERVEFNDAQISIEATARVGDVYQRIQVRAPSAAPDYTLLPMGALHATDGGVCKLVQTEPGSTSGNGCP